MMVSILEGGPGVIVLILRGHSQRHPGYPQGSSLIHCLLNIRYAEFNIVSERMFSGKLSRILIQTEKAL